MAWLPISGTLPQYSTSSNGLASDYYLKFYASGTATPINMATDSTGATEIAKCALSADGYPITNPLDDSTRFIPHIDQDYRIVLYTNETDADNNSTGNAAFNIDGMVLLVTPTGDAANITLRNATIEEQDDYDRSPLFTDGDGFTAGAGPHVIAVPTDWTPTDSDVRFYRLDNSGIVTSLTPTSTSSTTFTLAETLLSTDVIFIGDDEFRDIENIDRLKASTAEVSAATPDRYPDAEKLVEYVTNYIASLVSSWNINAASYSSNSFSVSSQDGTPMGLAFSDDGTKMYMVGDVNSTVYEYNLSTAWDVSTASYSSNSFSVTSQDADPRSLFFKTDGTKMYMLGDFSGVVYEYDLSTAWDVSTASYSSNSFSVASQDGNMLGLAFKTDGTKMYTVGSANDEVYEYSLSTAWDVSTASYSSNSFSVNSEEPLPNDVFFKTDGTKMYIVGTGLDTVYEYELSTAWSVSTASYSSNSFSVTDQEGAPSALFFKEDGTKMYTVGAGSDTVYEYITNFIHL